MLARFTLLPIVAVFILSACDPKENETSKSRRSSSGLSETEPVATMSLASPLVDGIELPFDHSVLMDMKSGATEHMVRKILIQVLRTPLPDAITQLQRSFELAGYRELHSEQGYGTDSRVWSKDGKPLEESRQAVAIQGIMASDPKNPEATGTLSLEIHSAENR